MPHVAPRTPQEARTGGSQRRTRGRRETAIRPRVRREARLCTGSQRREAVRTAVRREARLPPKARLLLLHAT